MDEERKNRINKMKLEAEERVIKAVYDLKKRNEKCGYWRKILGEPNFPLLETYADVLGFLDNIDKYVKVKYAAELKSPEIMAKILGEK